MPGKNNHLKDIQSIYGANWKPVIKSSTIEKWLDSQHYLHKQNFSS